VSERRKRAFHKGSALALFGYTPAYTKEQNDIILSQSQKIQIGLILNLVAISLSCEITISLINSYHA
jgi:hypothetical protein